ncbi:MAG: VIT1/CCC1 transporter family protein [Synergistetes bacterium]|nr:VIT1/CCC1 transporter family protein [Synergistota bacterium]MCX8128048.1 VIT1/CCC1 transporter family protein [Synergistota bacterium]MDW8193086.1 VIT1/CCC1 transporter family protein [Synergistota bacterium]
MNEVGKLLIEFQKDEITQSLLYERIAKSLKDENKKILENMALDERDHYERLKKYTGRDVFPQKYKLLKFFLLWKVFGLTFVIKLMEKGEERAREGYRKILSYIPEINKIFHDEEKHEKELTNMIDEKRLKYVSSMILGVSDAIVELTGAVAGLTFAFQNSELVGAAGMITGIAASLSMSVSEYLSQKSELEEGKSPISAAVYTGFAYIIAVFFLVIPFFIFEKVFLALGLSLLNALLIIALFCFFVSVVKEEAFKRNFFEMALLSFSVAGVSFVIGALARKFLGIEI